MSPGLLLRCVPGVFLEMQLCDTPGSYCPFVDYDFSILLNITVALVGITVV